MFYCRKEINSFLYVNELRSTYLKTVIVWNFIADLELYQVHKEHTLIL